MNKMRLAVAGILLLAISGNGRAEDIRQALTQCGQVQNSLKRLICYDQIVKDLNKYSGLDGLMDVPAPLSPQGRVNQPAQVYVAPQQPQSSRPAAPSVNSEQGFGLSKHEAAKQAISKELDRIDSSIIKLKKNPYGNLIVTLANGQVWRQTESSNLRIKVGQSVYVEKGVLGAFFLSREDVSSRIKVKRIK